MRKCQSSRLRWLPNNIREAIAIAVLAME